jgi:hypothetical protein
VTDTRNRSHAKMLGINKKRLKMEAFGHPVAQRQNAAIRARGEAYWMWRHSEDKKPSTIDETL